MDVQRHGYVFQLLCCQISCSDVCSYYTHVSSVHIAGLFISNRFTVLGCCTNISMLSTVVPYTIT